jgi:hypothetical protein
VDRVLLLPWVVTLHRMPGGGTAARATPARATPTDVADSGLSTEFASPPPIG